MQYHLGCFASKAGEKSGQCGSLRENNMKIVLVTEFFHPSTGGTQTVVAAIANELSQRGHIVTVLAPLAAGHDQTSSPNRAYSVVLAPLSKRSPYGHLKVQFRIWQQIPKDADVIHVFHPAFGLAGLATHRLRPIRLVVSLMGYDTYGFAKMPRLKQFMSLAVCRNADIVTAPSRDLARAARSIGVLRDIAVIPHGTTPVFVNPNDVTSLRRSLNIEDGMMVFVAVQRHHSVKHPTIFLDAWQCSAQSDYRLILVGGGEQESFLRRRAAELGLTNVSIVGEVSREDVPSYLALADVFLHHSRYESFGLGVLEAMRAGLPIIACGVGAVPEIITDGVEGLLVPPSRPAAMAAAMTQLAESLELRTRMAAAAGKRAREFRWDRLVDRYEQMYRAKGFAQERE